MRYQFSRYLELTIQSVSCIMNISREPSFVILNQTWHQTVAVTDTFSLFIIIMEENMWSILAVFEIMSIASKKEKFQKSQKIYFEISVA